MRRHSSEDAIKREIYGYLYVRMCVGLGDS